MIIVRINSECPGSKECRARNGLEDDQGKPREKKREDVMARSKCIAIAVVVSVVFGAAAWAESSLTIYNQNFAVVRESLALNLQRGTNEVSVTQITAHLEPDSVILRDPQGKRALQILE